MVKASYKIAGIRSDGTATKIFLMEPVHGERMQFKPGQFVKLFFPGNDKDFRMFSLASAPGEKSLEFCIKILPDGKFSQVIDRLEVGAMLDIEGPFGHFVYSDQSKCVFVAAGTGIAPVLSMLRHIKNKNIRGEFTLFFTNKTKDAILYQNELRQLEQDGIHVVYTITREQPEDWKGELGRIDSSMIDKYVKNAGECNWYFCGPLEFVKMIKQHALDKGVQPQNIKMEGWG